MTKRDMRTRPNRQHLGTAANRNAYEQQGHVVVQENKGKQEGQQEQGQGQQQNGESK